MLTPSKKFHCAVEAVLYIAYNTSSMPISSKELAKKQGLQPRYLEQIMQKLVHAGLLRSVRGPHGGYMLAKERRRISLGEICEILEEEESKGKPAAGGTSHLGHQIVSPLWQKINSSVMERLHRVTVAELCDQAAAGHIRKSFEERMDFTI